VSPQKDSVCRFGVFEFDVRNLELRKSGVRVKLQDKPRHVLIQLLEHSGELVSREELRSLLWRENTFVDFETGLNTAVKRLRETLGDSADNPTFIETIPRRGYKFIAPVEWTVRDVAPSRHIPASMPGAPSVPLTVPDTRGWNVKWVVGLSALAAIAAVLFFVVENRYLAHTRLGMFLRRTIGATRSAEPRPFTQRRLTVNPGDTPVTGGVLSPDGKYLAYSDPSGFYLRLVNSGETRRLPMPDGFDPLPESWFPDGTHLVVTSFGDKRISFGPGVPPEKASGAPVLFKISVLGGTPQKLAERGLSASVSPDGSEIAFLAGLPWDVEEIWLIQADGSNARKIVDGGRDEFGNVAWASDSKAFACVRTISNSRLRRPARQIEFHDLTDGHTEVLLSEPRLGDHVAWMNGGQLLYSLEEDAPNQSDSNVWSIHVDNHRRPVGSPTRITNDHGLIAGISVAEDGKRVAILREASQADIYVTEVDPRTKQLSTPHRLTLDERDDWANDWTLDGKSVVYVSERDGPMQIYRQDIAETQPELLVGANDDIVRWPRLTPDGLSVLYGLAPKAGAPSANVRLMRVAVSGGPPQLVFEEAGFGNFSCARVPSNVCIYDLRDSKSPFHQFFILDPAETKRKEILAGRIKNENGLNFWNLSPDGTSMVTQKSQNPYDAPALRIFNLSTGAARDLPVPEAGLIFGMNWAADSKSVWLGAFMGRGAWGTRSGILNVDLTGKTRVLLKGSNPELLYAVPSPDGRRLALGARSRTSNIWLLENF